MQGDKGINIITLERCHLFWQQRKQNLIRIRIYTPQQKGNKFNCPHVVSKLINTLILKESTKCSRTVNLIEELLIIYSFKPVSHLTS